MMSDTGHTSEDPAEQMLYPKQVLEEGSSQFKLVDILAVLRRQRKIVLPTILAGPLAAALVTSLMPRIYEGTATVKIDNERPKIFEGQDLDPVVALSDTNRYLQTLSRLLESRSLAQSVSEKLRLANNDAFIRNMGGEPADPNLPAKERAQVTQARVVGLLLKNISMVVPTDNRIVTIRFTSRDRVLAARIADAYAEKFINQNVLQRYQTNAYARKILSDQVDQTRMQLQDTEKRAIEYARAFRLIDVGDAAAGAPNGDGGGDKGTGSARSITTASLVDINAAYSGAKAQRILAEERWRTARASSGTELPEARDNSAMQTLLTQRSLAAAKLAQLTARYKPGQPEVREAQAEVASTDAQIRAVGQMLKASIHDEFIIAQRRENALEQAKDALANQTLEEQNKRVQLNLLARDADMLRQQLADLLERLNQITAASGVNTNNITLVDRAEIPTAPISPNSTRNLLLGLAAGIVLAAVLALLREVIDDTLHSPEDVESKLKLPLLGVTPFADVDIWSELENNKSALSEAYYSARTAVDYASGPAQKILMITSSSPFEGKSTTALALARDFTRIGRRVLLVDADLRRPALHRPFQIKKEAPGISDVLVGSASLEDAVITDEGSNLHFLPAGALPSNPVHLLSSEIVDAFFANLRKDYDVIIIDSPPVMGLADTPLLSRIADAVIFVVEASRAHNGQAKIAIRRLRDIGANLIGAIMTKFNPEASGYDRSAYEYYYYYSKGYEYDESEASQTSRNA